MRKILRNRRSVRGPKAIDTLPATTSDRRAYLTKSQTSFEAAEAALSGLESSQDLPVIRFCLAITSFLNAGESEKPDLSQIYLRRSSRLFKEVIALIPTGDPNVTHVATKLQAHYNLLIVELRLKSDCLAAVRELDELVKLLSDLIAGEDKEKHQRDAREALTGIAQVLTRLSNNSDISTASAEKIRGAQRRTNELLSQSEVDFQKLMECSRASREASDDKCGLKKSLDDIYTELDLAKSRHRGLLLSVKPEFAKVAETIRVAQREAGGPQFSDIERSATDKEGSRPCRLTRIEELIDLALLYQGEFGVLDDNTKRELSGALAEFRKAIRFLCSSPRALEAVIEVLRNRAATNVSGAREVDDRLRTWKPVADAIDNCYGLAKSLLHLQNTIPGVEAAVNFAAFDLGLTANVEFKTKVDDTESTLNLRIRNDATLRSLASTSHSQRILDRMRLYIQRRQ